MSEKLSQVAAERVYKVPEEVHNANWRDDVGQEGEEQLDFETLGTPKEEIEYKSPEKVDPKVLKRIKSIKVGANVMDVLNISA